MNRDVAHDSFKRAGNPDVLGVAVPHREPYAALPATMLRAAAALLRVLRRRRGARGFTLLLPDGQLVITCCRKLAQLAGPPLRPSACDRLACD